MRSKTWGARAMRAGRAGSVAVMLCFVCMTAVGEDFLHARVSYDAGTSMVKGRDDADWSYATINTIVLPGDTLWVDKEGTMELEMSGGSFLRMADGSKADIESLPPSGKVRGWNGSFYVQRIGRSTGSLEFDTPVGIVDFDPNSQVRIDILTDGGTTVSVRWGHAVVRCPAGGDTSLNAGQRSYIDPGYLPSEPTAFDANVEDDFDSWNRDRARLLAEGEERIPPAAHIEKAPIGVADLSPYGEWVEVDSSYYWRPTVVVDYVPYRNGHWSYVSGAGYCWVGGYPFSYVTSHYGRWRHTEHYGWVWTYRDTWGPAWVETVHYGPNFVWTPLDPFDRPCVVVGDTFAVGHARFGFYASSYCVADDLLVGSCYVRPMSAVVISTVPVAQIAVWNIWGSSYHDYHHHHDFAHDAHLEVRDYAPKRVIRGFDTLAAKEPAHARVSSLETSFGRHDFTTHQGEPARKRAEAVRPEGRGAQPRSVRVASDIRESSRDPRRSAELMRSPMTPEGRKVPDAKDDRRDRTGGPEADQAPRRGSDDRRGPSDATREPGRSDAKRGERSAGPSGRDAGRTPPEATRERDRSTTRGERSAGPAGRDAGRTPPEATRERDRSTTPGERSAGPAGRDVGRTPPEATRESGRSTTRGERSAAPSTERQAPRSRTRETGPAPVPMRGPEAAPSRTAPQRSESIRSGSGEGAAPRSEGLRERRSSSGPVTAPAPTRSEGTRIRGAEPSGRESSRSVQVQRLAPVERQQVSPRQERGSSMPTAPAPRAEQRPQAPPQMRQDPVRREAPAEQRGSRGTDRDNTDSRRRR